MRRMRAHAPDARARAQVHARARVRERARTHCACRSTIDCVLADASRSSTNAIAIAHRSSLARSLRTSFFEPPISDNKLRVIKGDVKATTVQEWTCDLDNLSPGRATAFGVVSSGTVWNTSATTERLAIASGNGFVYALNYEQCLPDRDFCAYTNASTGNNASRASPPQPPSLRNAAAGAGAAAKGGAVGDPGDCMQWDFEFPSKNPSFGPTRYVQVPLKSSPGGIVLVTESNPSLDTGGVLHALNADTGALIWSHSATRFNGSVSAGLIGVVPAVDSDFRNFTIYLGYSAGIVALSAWDGSVRGSWQGSLSPVDPFVSSVTLTAAGTRLFAHSATGTVRAFTISGPASGSIVTFTPLWACDYTLSAFYGGRSMCTNVSLGLGDEPLQWPVRDAVTGVVLRTETRLRSDFVTCGWPQATSRAERAELWDAIVGLYRAKAAAGALVPLDAPQAAEAAAAAERLLAAGGPSASASEAQACSDVAALARALPIAELHALRTPSGYARAGARVGAGIANPFWFEAAYPYSTPSLLPGEGSVVVPQYEAVGTDTGVFLANATTGAAIWAFSNLTVGFYFNRTTNQTLPYIIPFGRSRSSAAVDASGSFFVGSDLTCGPPFDCTDNEGLPALFAFSTYSLVPGATDFGDDPLWVTNMGLEATVPIGSASPVVRAGLFSDREVYMVAYDGTVGITQGEECPSDAYLIECSNHGACDCATGICACEKCYSGANCSVYDAVCGGGGGGGGGNSASSGLGPGELAGAVAGPILFFAALGLIVVYSWKSRNPGSTLKAALGFDSGESGFEGSALLSTGGAKGKAARQPNTFTSL